MRHLRWFDWKFMISFIFLLLVSYLIWVGYNGVLDSREKEHRINALVSQINEQNLLASNERAIAAENQQRLLDYTKTLATRQDNLLEYLRAHGIHIPVRYLRVIPPRLVHIQSRRPTRNSRSFLPPALQNGNSSVPVKPHGHRPPRHRH